MHSSYSCICYTNTAKRAFIQGVVSAVHLDYAAATAGLLHDRDFRPATQPKFTQTTVNHRASSCGGDSRAATYRDILKQTLNSHRSTLLPHH